MKIGHANFTLIDTPALGQGAILDTANIEKIKQLVLSEGGIDYICIA
jgi:hypothetical protein